MAKWQPRVTPETEAALQAIGPYSVPQGGYLALGTGPGVRMAVGTFQPGLRGRHKGCERRRLSAAPRRLDAGVRQAGDSHVGNGGTAIPGPMYGRSLCRSASGSRGCREYCHAGPRAISVLVGITSRHTGTSGE